MGSLLSWVSGSEAEFLNVGALESIPSGYWPVKGQGNEPVFSIFFINQAVPILTSCSRRFS
jgi:hypothetical protein